MVGQDGTLVDPRTGATIAQGVQRPDVVSAAPGGQIFAVGPDGSTQMVAQSTAQRPPSDADQTAIQRADMSITQADGAIGRARRLVDMINRGDLRLGMLERAGAEVEVATGRASPNALAIKDLEQWAKQARDAILQANTGVQTDQDAIRALDNVLANMNDPRLVQQYLNQFIESTTSSRQVFQRDIERRMGQSAPRGAPSSNVPSLPPGFQLD